MKDLLALNKEMKVMQLYLGLLWRLMADKTKTWACTIDMHQHIQMK
jgi:hypothetical protein